MEACLCRLVKEIGFTVDALQVFSKRREIFTCAPCHSSLKERVRNDRLEVPSMISSIYEETDAGNFNNVINVYKCICVCDFFLMGIHVCRELSVVVRLKFRNNF